MKEIKILSTDNINQLNVYIWETGERPVAILQISHGMKEHMGRYDDFARFMVSNNVMVIGNDHLGHGQTVVEDDLGYFGHEKSKTVVEDLHKVTLYAKETYGNDIPYFLLGHSMGSFMARRYIMTYGNELSGVVLSGTGSQPGIALIGGKIIAGLVRLIKGERYKSRLLKIMCFASYNSRIENPKTESDWLSKDEKIVEEYNNDKLCTYDFTVNGYETLFDAISFIQKKSNINKIPKDLPVYFISGSEDPVGSYGKGVEKAYDDMCNAGINDIDIELCHGGRHEMLNEIERDGVYEDINSWIKKHISHTEI